MRVLIVDDSEVKSDEIEIVLRDVIQPHGRLTPARVHVLSDAARVIGSTKFDLIVLDLMLPYIPHGQASSSAGIELLRQMRNDGNLNRLTPVVGLSAYPNEIAASRTNFDAAGVVLLTYADEAWKGSLREVARSAAAASGSFIDVDFVAVCALEEEREGFKNHVFETGRADVSGLNVQFVESKICSGQKGAIIRLREMGLVSATLETCHILSRFRTPLIFMSGICAGMASRTKPGQIVVASPAWEYQAGKWSTNGFEIAPNQVRIRPNTQSIIDHLITGADIQSRLEEHLPSGCDRPKKISSPLLAPFASGSSVIAETRHLSHILQQHRKIAAIDMETFGLYYAADQSDCMPHFFSAKAVVDFADDQKCDDFHTYGSSVSARFGLECASLILANHKRHRD